MTEALEPEPRGRRIDWTLVLVLVAGAFLLLANLDETYLWTDECEAAWLGRSILDRGVPTAFDGRNYLTQWVVAKREDFNDDLVWVLSPWLQQYVCAASFAVLGVSTLAARLPFALIGIFDLALIYFLARRLTGDRRIARTASLLLLTCIPFLLHARQGRYYTFAMLGTMWAVHAYTGLLDRKRWSTVQLVLAISILFHSNYGLCVPVVGGLVLHALFYAWKRARPWQVVAVPAGIALLTLPWALFANIHRTASRFDVEPYFYNLFHYVFAINRWALPLPFVLLFCVLRPLGWKSAQLSLGNRGVTAAALVGVLGVAFVSTNTGLFTRYVINLVPLFVMLCAVFVVWFADGVRERAGAGPAQLAWAVVPLLMFTTAVSWPVAPALAAAAKASPHRPYQDNPAVRRSLSEFVTPRHEIFDLLHEVTNPYDGPLEGVARFLVANGERDQTVFIDYGDLPLLFYTDLKVRGGLQGIPYHGRPEWIVSRTNRVGIAVNSLRELALEEGYVPIVLDGYPDTRWENRPDPFVHFYRQPPVGDVAKLTDGVYPSIVLFKRPDVALVDRMGARVGAGGKR